MIRISEIVLPGHPDKYCDQVADAIVAECVRIDPDAYAQIEIAVWSCQLWLTGGVCTRRPLARPLRDIVVETGLAIGYVPGNHVDANRYTVHSAVCEVLGDPARFTGKVNDQSVVLGWAGYDARTRYLPPEHYLCHVLREALAAACADGPLAGQGPDGKLLLRLREEGGRWIVEHLLVTLQQRADAAFMDVCEGIVQVLARAYAEARERDPRWRARWDEIELMINPNGPLVQAGSNGDNGQTGRKLVMDFYGPRVPIGGGALSGKHLSHIDRIGSYGAREAAVRAVQSGASECLVRVAYAPNVERPLDVCYEMVGRGERRAAGFFDHPELVARYPASAIGARLGQGLHFFDPGLPWNGGGA
ncbi:MAG: methionine adenosyltransferase domain-containing protein [bacterium]|nr:methionine adenosyltransferase domain-containing protein [bacterium]